MKFGKTALVASAASLAVAPIAAQAADRAAAPVDGESELAGNAGGILAIFGVLAIATFIFASGDDEPASP